MRAVVVALVVLVVSILPSCASTSVRTKSVDEGLLKTSGASIAAEDGSFVLNAGQPFAPPFECNAWGSRVTNVMRSNNLTSQSAIDAGYRSGAKRVMVTVPGRTEPLYGLLLLNRVAVTAQGPAARSYLIDIPPEYIAAAKDGNVSVVYEPVFWTQQTGARSQWYGWVLWLSDRPFVKG